MALLDPAGDRSANHGSGAPHQPTKHPMICLACGFGFIIVAALAVHVVFNALL